MKTIAFQISTVEEALNLNNIAAIKHAKFANSKVKGSEAESALFARMWKEIYLQSGVALEELRAEKYPNDVCVFCGTREALITDDNDNVICLACMNEGDING